MKKSFSIQSQLLLAIVTLSVTTAACSRREVPVTQHDAPITGDEVVTPPAAPPVTLKELQAVDMKSSSAFEKVAPIILNQSNLDDPQLVSKKEMREALRLYNKHVIDLVQAKSPQASAWVEKTRVMIEGGCDGLMVGCRNLAFFAPDPNSYAVMAASAKEVAAQLVAAKAEIKAGAQAEDYTKVDGLVRLYYRRLNLAMILKSRQLTPELAFLYLEHAADFTAAFGRSKNKERERELLTQHTNSFEMILNRHQPDLSTSESRARFEAFINAFSPWDFSRRQDNAFGGSANRMLTLAAKNFIYDSKTGQLADSLKKTIAATQAPLEKDTKVDPIDLPFGQNVQTLKTDAADLWKNLSLDDSFARDEYFYLVDRLYLEHLTLDDAQVIWNGSHRDTKKLLKVAEQYLKIQFVAQIRRTNLFMSEVYSNRDWSSQNLFINAVEKSRPIEAQWEKLLPRANVVDGFLYRIAKPTDFSLENESTKQYQDFREMMLSLSRNIKFLSVYPNMMLMSYLIADERFEFKVRTSFGNYDITSATIITSFFNGELAPLFKFGNDGNPLNRLETLYSFIFALKTNAFGTFSVSKLKKLDVSSFFDLVIGKFLDDERLELETDLTEVRRLLTPSTDLSTYFQTCRQDRELMSKNKVKPGMGGAKFKIDLTNLDGSLYMGSHKSIGREPLTFHTLGRVQDMQKITGKLQSKLEFVDLMVRIYERHLERNGVVLAERNVTIKKIRDHLAEVERMKTEYLTETLRWHKLISDCVDHSVVVEIDRQDDMIALEAEQVRRIWRAMNTARKTGQDTTLIEINKELRKSLDIESIPMPRDSKGNLIAYKQLSNVSRDYYTFNKLDLLMRVRKHLRTVAPNVEVVMPSDLTDTSFWRDDSRLNIAYVENEETFVRQAMKSFGQEAGTTISWISDTSDASTFKYRIAFMAEIYKMGKFKIYDTEAASCRGTSDISKCPTMDYEMQAKELVDEMSNIARLLSMTKVDGQPKKDVAALDLVSAEYRWSKRSINEFTLDKNGLPLPLFETMYLNFAEDRSPLTKSIEFSVTERSVGRFLFTAECDYRNVIYDGFDLLQKQYFQRLKMLDAAVTAREKKDAADGQVVDYAYERTIFGQMQKIAVASEDGRPVYVGRSKMDTKNRENTFASETDRIFVKGRCQ